MGVTSSFEIWNHCRLIDLIGIVSPHSPPSSPYWHRPFLVSFHLLIAIRGRLMANRFSVLLHLQTFRKSFFSFISFFCHTYLFADIRLILSKREAAALLPLLWFIPESTLFVLDFFSSILAIFALCMRWKWAEIFFVIIFRSDNVRVVHR